MDHYDEGMNLSCGPYLYTRLTRFSLSIIRFRLLSYLPSRPGTAGSMRNPNLYGRVTDNMHGETPSSARMTPSPQSVAMLPEKTGSAIVKRDKDFEEGASAATIQSATGENATVMRILRPGSSGGGNQNQAAASHVGDASLLGSAFAPPRPRSPVRWDFAAPQKRFMTPPAQMVDTSAGAAALTTKDGSNRGAGRSSRRGSTRQGASRPGSAAMRSQLDGRPTTPGAMTTYRSSFGLGTPRTHPWSRSGGLQTIPLSLSLQLSSGAHAPDPARGGGVGGPFAPVTSTGPTNAAGSRLRNASDGAQQQQMNSPQPQSSSSPSSPPLPTNAPTIPTQPQNILRLSTPSLTPMLGVRSFGARSAVHRDFFSDTSIGFGSRDAKFHAEKYFEVKSLTSDYLEGIRTPKMFWRK
jgi:hypothetical protein